MNDFLPEGHECLKTEKSYWKMSQMKDGDNRLRIVIKPIAGWLDWNDKKPVRFRPNSKPSLPFNADKPIKAFWDCYVWDYAREALFILEITQSSILKSLTSFATDSDWGDFTKYDIKINKQGTGKETRYTITPLPHKPLASKIEDAIKRSPVRLEALYEGRDPWTDLEPSDLDLNTGEITQNSPIGSSFDELKELLEIEGIDTSMLEEYLYQIADKKKQSFDEVVKTALTDNIFPKFKAAFIRDVA